MKDTPRLAAVDGLRAMAMLMVFTYHTWQFSNRPHFVLQFGSHSFETVGNSVLGWQGVPVFMVLSGFCLFFPLCFDEERIRNFHWRSYAMRRVRRIVPPYYAAILCLLIIKGLVATAQHLRGLASVESVSPSPLDLLAHVTFTHSLSQPTYGSIVGAWWTLGLEAQFYLMFPLIVWAFARIGVRALFAVVTIFFCYQALTHSLGIGGDVVVAAFFLAHWTEFAAGMGTALLVAKHLKRGVNTPAWPGAALILGPFRISHSPTPLLSKSALLELHRSLAIGVLLYALCTTTRSTTFLWSNRVSAGVGFISYSFFLIHQPTIWYFSRFILHFNPKISDVLLFATLMTVDFAFCLTMAYGFFSGI